LSQVQAAKAQFTAEYQRATVRNAVAGTPYGAHYATPYGTPVVAVETRHKRDLSGFKTFQTPASTSPLVYAAATPYATPYAAHTYAATPYTAAVTPYAAASPYVYGSGYYNTYASYPYAY